MLDFVKIDDSRFEKDTRVINPKFIIKIPPKDLMIRGGKLYGVWDEDNHMWIRDDHGEGRNYVKETVDAELSRVSEKYKAMGANTKVNWMWDADSRSMDRFIKYVEKQMPSNCFHVLDEKVIFSNTETKKEDYASKKLPYAIGDGDIQAYERLIGALYDPEEKEKLEWAVGAVISGDSKYIQKFLVLHGDSGYGKSTFLNIVQDLFEGYWVPIDFKGMGRASNDFALESFKTNPLVGIQHDGDLSKIEDNTLINQIVSHETVEVNEKHNPKYPARFNTFLFMGTNRPVKITEAKSGIIRRLIDVKPSGNKVPRREYDRLVKQVRFELGAIAYHCLEVYQQLGDSYYDDYIPVDMLAATNDFYDFMVDRYDEYVERDAVTQDEAWRSYKEYCEYSGARQAPLRIMAAELKNYFREFQERATIDGVRVRKLYSGFKTEKFEAKKTKKRKGEQTDEKSEQDLRKSSSDRNVDIGSGTIDNIDRADPGEERGDNSGLHQDGINWLTFKQQPSIFDREYAEYPAQYETEYRGNLQPEKRWANVKTKLKDLDTSKTHYVLGPSSLIFIDFDIKNAEGKKDFELNKAAASTLPPTYAELSKSGGGIHLYYIYTGDVSELADKLGEDIEIKVCPEGKKSPIRRMLTLCNDVAIAVISSGLPKKGDRKKVVSWEGIKDENHLKNIINMCLRREGSFGPHTSENIQQIKKALDEAYESGMVYDVSELKHAVEVFAGGSTNQKDICLAMVDEMHFSSAKENEALEEEEIEEVKPIVLDIEIYPPDELEATDPNHNEGLFLICWKYLDAPADTIVDMINPAPWEVSELFHYKIIGFNIKEYDAPMLVGRAQGDGNARSYDRSYRMITLNDNSAKPRGSDKIAWVDVYDIWKAAGQGQSLKKIEIMMSNLARLSDADLGAMKLDHNQMKAVMIFRGIATHKEMELPWGEPAPKDKWPEIIKYCHNDVLATEAAYWYGQAFLNARRAQVNLVKGLHPECTAALIDTANNLTKKAIFGENNSPQNEFNYRNLALPVGSDRYEEYVQKFGPDYQFRVWNNEGLPEYRDYEPGEVLPEGWSILPFFPGYTFDPYAKKSERSTFHGDHGGEGGRTYSLKGMYTNVWDGDIASQYPHSIMAEVLFGPRYTKIFAEIVEARVAVKHRDFETAGRLLNGALASFLSEETAGDLAQALKIIINSVYGLTTASFPNEFLDPRNIDNFVAKRGNLFMLVLKEQIEARGYTVCHIKTDSIKIVDADQFIQDFVIEFGKEYGYTFETEGYFDKFVLLNDAAYVAHEKGGGWITKAKQFQEAYVRKTLFTKEPVTYDDLVQVYSVTGDSALYLDKNEKLPDVVPLEKEAESLRKKMEKGSVAKGYSSLDEMRARIEELLKEIPSGHDYHFVGRVGSFVPVKDGYDGGYLYREKNDKYYAAAGSSGYRWLESEYAREVYGPEAVNMDFFTDLAEKAIKDISKYGDFEWFVNAEIKNIPIKEPFVSVETLPLSDEPFMNIPIGADDELPWDE